MRFWKKQPDNAGRVARNKLRKAMKRGVLPKNSRELYKAMKKAGLDIE